MRRLAALFAVMFVLSGCYHAIVDTGRPMSGTVVNKPFQPSFIYGIVPPPPLNVSAECKSGVARVETMHSFVEGLIGGLTFGIFTPMTIKVTCATGPGMTSLPEGTIKLGANATAAERAAAIQQAADLAYHTGVPAYVKY